MECRAEGFGQLIVAGGQAAKLFELAEEALDAVAPAVEVAVIAYFLAAGAERRNDRFDPVQRQTLPDAIGVVAFVQCGGLQHVVDREAFVERFKLPSVVRLARGQVERDRTVFVDRCCVDFG